MRLNCFLNVLLTLVAGLTGVGCVAAAVGGVGAGAVAYVRGELESQVAHPYEAVVAATHKAIADLELVPGAIKKDGLRATVEARNADDKQISVRLERVAQRVTTVKIRIGVFGDQMQSQLILDQIRASL